MSAACCPLSGSDGDTPTCFTKKIRRARKEHHCCECGDSVRPGDRYEHVSGIWDREPSSYKTCLSCREIRDHFACDGYVCGELWNDLHENFIPHMRAGGPCMEGLSAAAKHRLFAVRLEWLATDEGEEYLAKHAARPPAAAEPKEES